MTKLLEKAFQDACKLLEVEQNAHAKWLLEELHSEAKWERAFGESEDVLEKLADGALEEKRKGKTTPRASGVEIADYHSENTIQICVTPKESNVNSRGRSPRCGRGKCHNPARG